MGSTKNYLDLGQQERDNLSFVLDDAAVSVEVYRKPAQSGVAGLTEETAEAELLRTITVRIDGYRSATSERIQQLPIGLTDDTDVRPDDLWRYTDVANTTRWFRVKSAARTPSTSSVMLEEIKR